MEREGESWQPSAREAQVLELLVAGLCNKEIAARLGISCKTVEFHLTRLYERSGCAGRVQLAVHAARYPRVRADDST